MDKDPFREYIKQSEPNRRDKGYAWYTAIGLQAVDGLKPSKYLIDTAIKNIEGDISIDEAQELLNTYYEENPKADTAAGYDENGNYIITVMTPDWRDKFKDNKNSQPVVNNMDYNKQYGNYASTKGYQEYNIER